MKYNYLLKAIDQYLKCHQTIQNGWHDGIHFIKDNNNSQFERLINRDTFSENYKLNTKNGKIEEKDSEMMNNIQLEGFEKESYSDWIYPHYEDICQYQRYGTVDTDEDSLLFKTLEEEGWVEDGIDLDRIAEDSIKGTIDDLHKLFDKSEGLSENCTIYRGGSLPKNIKVGDEGEFDTFTSASYKMIPALSFAIRKSTHDENEKCFIKIFAPKGTPALIGTPKFCETYHEAEHEITLKDHQRYKIIDRDDSHGKPPIITMLLINE